VAVPFSVKFVEVDCAVPAVVELMVVQFPERLLLASMA
jgi:hypothetical protein